MKSSNNRDKLRYKLKQLQQKRQGKHAQSVTKKDQPPNDMPDITPDLLSKLMETPEINRLISSNPQLLDSSTNLLKSITNILQKNPSLFESLKNSINTS